MQLEVPSHKAKKITGITRKYTSEFSLLALGFNILALIIFNTRSPKKQRLKEKGWKGKEFLFGRNT